MKNHLEFKTALSFGFVDVFETAVGKISEM